MKRSFVLVLVIAIFGYVTQVLGWQPCGVIVSDAQNSQRNAQVVPDGLGGAIIAWQDSVNGNWDIYARRVDSLGVAMWTSNGIAICDASGEQSDPCITPDGTGGAIIAWQDFRNGSSRIYAQRVSGLGSAQWSPNGVPVCDTTSSMPSIAGDGSGGAFITWVDSRNLPTSWYDVYAQKLDSSGAVLWTSGGALVCNSTGWERYAQVVSDGLGGAIIVWEDERNDAGDIYAQRLDASGGARWSANGVVVCSAADEQNLFLFYSQFCEVVSDDSGGVIVVWQDHRSGTEWDIYAQRVDSTGAAVWPANGVALSTASYNQMMPVLTRDGYGGAIAAWMDSVGGVWDIYAQKVDASGSTQWTPNGVPVCAAANAQSGHALAPDGTGGAIVTWHDQRAGAIRHLYAQRLSAAGFALWNPDGLIISDAPNTRMWPAISADGFGGALIAWQDSVNGNWDIYAQRIHSSGLLATHNVGTASVDQPADTVTCGDSVLVAATVCNYGDTTETFDVEAIIDFSGIGVYADTQTVAGLLPDSCTSVSFIDWSVPPAHGVNYSVTVTTLHPLDIDTTNNASSKSVMSWCPPHDVGVLSIDEPPDTVTCADTVMVVATVCNYGGTDESFDVAATVDSSGVGIHTDVQAVVALSPDSCQTVYFADWPVPDIHSRDYNVTVVTRLTNDVNPVNDTLIRGVVGWCPAYHDVALDFINEPWDTVWCGDTVAVEAGVCNYGDSVETFDVEALITDTLGVSVYADTQTVLGLVADSCFLVSFADWPVPYTHMTPYTVTMTVMLPTDVDPTNDTMSKYVTGWCPGWHDVLAAYISSPPDTVMCDSVILVEAIVCNYSDSTETFDVEAVIRDSTGSPVYADTATVMSLVTDTCVSISFQDWVVPAMDSMLYDVSIITLLPGDGDPTNDTVSKTVFGWCFTGVDEMLHRTLLPVTFRFEVPSPARGRAIAKYELPSQSEVRLKVYDVRGRLVCTPLDRVMTAGFGTAHWDGRNATGMPAASGIYFFEFYAVPQTEPFRPFRSTGKLIMLR